MKKRILIKVIVIIAITLFLVVKNFQKHNVENLEEEISQQDCVLFSSDHLIGDWQNIGSDYPALVTLHLEESRTFLYKVEEIDGERSYELEGSWEYIDEHRSLKLTFNNLNDVWENILKESNLQKDYSGVLSYSLDLKQAEFKVHYMARDEFTGCEEERYFVDILNVYLYKVAGKF